MGGLAVAEIGVMVGRTAVGPAGDGISVGNASASAGVGVFDSKLQADNNMTASKTNMMEWIKLRITKNPSRLRQSRFQKFSYGEIA